MLEVSIGLNRKMNENNFIDDHNRKFLEDVRSLPPFSLPKSIGDAALSNKIPIFTEETEINNAPTD